jgi:hypothetical protein
MSKTTHGQLTHNPQRPPAGGGRRSTRLIAAVIAIVLVAAFVWKPPQLNARLQSLLPNEEATPTPSPSPSPTPTATQRSRRRLLARQNCRPRASRRASTAASSLSPASGTTGYITGVSQARLAHT